MSILISAAIEVFDQESFHAIDRLVTGLAFDDLRAIQWVNLNGQTATFHTIKRS
jgi:hypothetical protein